MNGEIIPVKEPRALVGLAAKLAGRTEHSGLHNTSQTYLKFSDQPACAIFCVG